ncbi:MAG: hypothetical protein E5V22_11100 [Mesorhizobium sp.]|uniref:hypothetical protein n=1 Tax=Mesorhizobium sp. TaxID=1871066 RepID=UPI000FE4FC60|nr:hypothetical protein [Mesorhizobium sp.]RWE59809.1 MAG: hypothetical protein EOS24_15455 [Mesorhizobium sp.]TIX06067.1 MAG: hypothetical protein E5V57_07610 [Mesorhizobium sp.]TIY04482.1 MAG: hypothetical protein E5V22_11100 [Mesorhizobium sp.]
MTKTTPKPRRFEISASRWPWQAGYNWRGMTNCTAPLNSGDARFGGGWKYKLGVSTGGWRDTGISFMIDLLFGIVTVRYRTRKGVDQELKWRADAVERKQRREDAARREEAAFRERVRERAERDEREAARRAALTPEQREVEDSVPF